MAINLKKVTKDKLIEMLTEERGKREALETAENVLRTKLKKADERYEALEMIRAYIILGGQHEILMQQLQRAV